MKNRISKGLITLIFFTLLASGFVFAETVPEDGSNTQDREPATESLSIEEKENVAVTETAENVAEEMKFLYIESRKLESPGIQNIAVSWKEDNIDQITKFILVYADSSDKSFELEEVKRTDKTILFAKDFTSAETGAYKIKGIKYNIEGIEEAQYLEFNEVEIAASFEVVDEISEKKEEIVDNNVAVLNSEATTEEQANQVQKLLAASEAASAPTNAKASKHIVVVLDPGHGGGDPGACRYGLKEKDLNLKIAKYCKKELEQYQGVSVYLTRSTDVDLNGLDNRVNIGSKYRANLFVSLHINAGGGTGAEVYYPNSNYNYTVYTAGRSASTQILNELNKLGLYSRGIKQSFSKDNTRYSDGSLADYYGIIRRSKLAGFPGLIVEHAFIDNANDATFLSYESNLKSLGVADATGIAKYYKLQKYGIFNDGQGWKYKKKDGTFFENGWLTVNGKKYYFENGYALLGWQTIEGNKYYFMPTAYVITGWFKFGSTKYYADSNGVLQKGLKTIANKKYYFDETSGKMKTGWQTVEGNKYYFMPTGYAITGWFKFGSTRYYAQKSSNGIVLKGLQTIGSKKYYFDETSGKMKTGWQTVAGNKYYFMPAGYAITGWFKFGSTRYYAQKSSKGIVLKGLRTIGSKKYYFDETSGKMKTGWKTINGKKYYFMPAGYAITGWFKFGSIRYYANSSGVVQTGSVNIGGVIYEFDSRGRLMQYAISGTSATNVSQMVRYYKSTGATYPGSVYSSKGASTITAFCKIYYEEAAAEGIKAEVAFCQAMKETGWLRYGGDVKAKQCNFAGIGATGGGKPGHTFSSVRIGARAHIQHLKAYANTAPLNKGLVDPRFGYVTRGTAPYVEWLGVKANPYGKGWAPSATYGTDIVGMIQTLRSK